MLNDVPLSALKTCFSGLTGHKEDQKNSRHAWLLWVAVGLDVINKVHLMSGLVTEINHKLNRASLPCRSNIQIPLIKRFYPHPDWLFWRPGHKTCLLDILRGLALSPPVIAGPTWDDDSSGDEVLLLLSLWGSSGCVGTISKTHIDCLLIWEECVLLVWNEGSKQDWQKDLLLTVYGGPRILVTTSRG